MFVRKPVKLVLQVACGLAEESAVADSVEDLVKLKVCSDEDDNEAELDTAAVEVTL